MIRLAVLILALALLVPVTQAAVSPDEVLDDPALEERARALGKELRCLVCQNQSIDDSDASLARDLRQVVRERLVAGDSDTQILDFLTDRYGDFVLLSPPVKPGTYMLWAGPALLFVLGAILLFRYLRQRPKGEVVEQLSENDAERAKRLLSS